MTEYLVKDYTDIKDGDEPKLLIYTQEDIYDLLDSVGGMDKSETDKLIIHEIGKRIVNWK